MFSQEVLDDHQEVKVAKRLLHALILGRRKGRGSKEVRGQGEGIGVEKVRGDGEGELGVGWWG